MHGGFNRHLEFKGQRPDIYYWDRDLWTAALSYQAFDRHNKHAGEFQMVSKFKEIFIGHTSTVNWKVDKPMKAANIYNLDTGGGHGGRLTIMELVTKDFWQSDPVSELY